MSLFTNPFKKKKTPIQNNDEFWKWFETHSSGFHRSIRKGNVDKGFFNKLAPKLDQLREGYWFLAGMSNDDTAELILTADGVIKNIPFVEDLVASAPTIDGWKFTALKPPSEIKDVNIQMEDLEFNENTLSFYSNEDPTYPDEIDITIIYANDQENPQDMITNGIYIFLDNYLGELNAISKIDNLNILEKPEEGKKSIPIYKLKEYVNWREKEFVEKYDTIRRDTAKDIYRKLEGTFSDGMPLTALINSTLLEWDAKASHPWILCIEIRYRGNEKGMPDQTTQAKMLEFEEALLTDLKDLEGYLKVGRQTSKGVRVIFFACREFRLPAKMASYYQSRFSRQLDVEIDLYKDKYWRTFEQYRS